MLARRMTTILTMAVLGLSAAACGGGEDTEEPQNIGDAIDPMEGGAGPLVDTAATPPGGVPLPAPTDTMPGAAGGTGGI